MWNLVLTGLTALGSATYSALTIGNNQANAAFQERKRQDAMQEAAEAQRKHELLLEAEKKERFNLIMASVPRYASFAVVTLGLVVTMLVVLKSNPPKKQVKKSKRKGKR